MEVGIDDLAMDSREAGPLLLQAGVELEARISTISSAGPKAGRSACTSVRWL